ncbi:hypothetical protein ABEB36_002239 [Hypothenemus hampei]|uniref:DUF4802 domain-containing protein n=1 Tax=Hypothenemus hampei TaxID=57062 RepID=A0ABD1F502_HYPHA
MNQKMELTLNLVSKICWEIVAKHFVHLNTSNSVLFKLLSDTVSDFLPNVSEENLKIYWKYSPDDYLQIKDHYTFCALINLLVPSCDLYLLLKDEQQLHANADVYFKMLDLIELKRIKELTRNKYDLKSEADVIQEQIKKCQEILESSSHEEDVKLRNDKDIIQFALRNMPMRRCYTTDICSGYNLIDCFRKAMKGRIINCSPHQDIYFLETHAKNEENNLENLFVSPAGREMLKYKPNTKLKQKIHPNYEFLSTIQNPNGQSSLNNDSNNSKPMEKPIEKTCSSPLEMPSTSSSGDQHEKNSLVLYEEAAAILGLTCSQTDDCRCIECQVIIFKI